MDPFMSGATCAMCRRRVHYNAGRVACDGCDLPTDCCLCEPLTGPAAVSSKPPAPARPAPPRPPPSWSPEPPPPSPAQPPDAPRSQLGAEADEAPPRQERPLVARGRRRRLRRRKQPPG